MAQITLKGQAGVRLQPDKASPFLKQTITAGELVCLLNVFCSKMTSRQSAARHLQTFKMRGKT